MSSAKSIEINNSNEEDLTTMEGRRSLDIEVLPIPKKLKPQISAMIHAKRRSSTSDKLLARKLIRRFEQQLCNGDFGNTSSPCIKFVDNEDDLKIILNVGGMRHETNKSTLLRYPGTPLYQLARLHTNSEVEYFVDRHPQIFSSVLNLYRSDQLHVPLDVCGGLMRNELEYWGISEDLIEPCCWTNYSAYKDAQSALGALDIGIEERRNDEYDYEVNFGNTKLQQLRKKMYLLLEDGSSSFCAKCIAFVNFLMVMTSITCLIIETHPYFRIKSNVNSSIHSKQNATKPHPALEYIDYACTIYFTLEFTIRFLLTSNKIQFWRNALNLLDFISLIPLYIVVLIDSKLVRKWIDPSEKRIQGANILKLILILRIVRVFRMFKLMKQYQALKILGYAVKASFRELLMLASFLSLFVILFATFIYYVEQDNMITSIPLGIWWALITMTTVGYGDVYPKTNIGYLIGCMCALCGVLVVALTIPIISNNFTLFYSHAQSRSRMYRLIDREADGSKIHRRSKNVSQSAQKLESITSKRHCGLRTPWKLSDISFSH